MKKALLVLAPLAALAAPLAFTASPAQAATGTSYQATLNPLNHATGSGTFWVSLNGSTATVHESWSGLAGTFSGAPYPHVQHIHIGGAGACPTTSADKNGDGVVSTTEGAAAYGGIGTTLSTTGDTSPAAGTNIKIAPAGSSTDYQRTIQLDSKVVSAIKSGNAVIVVHGLDPATLSKKAQGEKSDLVPSLPLAATSPALCGVVHAMPAGGVATGTGSTSGMEDSSLLGLAGGLFVAGAGMAMYTVRRKTVKA
ncbi:hypothetical protein [Nocardioides cynanchi]|uniref:hypothetical protein n=1 Tax=Nocardioides cynanchi TaxID=2558918 RepID=UPI0012451972|nr:hypothetical protein [Nocardioides cynanchi]